MAVEDILELQCLRPGDLWYGNVLRIGDTIRQRTLDGFVEWRLEADGLHLGKTITNAELQAEAEEVARMLRQDAPTLPVQTG